MNSIIYLLQVTACTAVFYLFYFVFLNRLTFFTTNRWYLLVTVLLSFIIPLVKIPVNQPRVYNNIVQQAVYTYSPQEFTPIIIHPEIVKTEPIHWGILLKFTYLAAVLALTIHLIITLATFFKRVKNKRITKLGNVHILSANDKITNGSFLNYIFLNEQELSPDEIQQIIAHEMLHVKLYHSIDRILVKLAQIVLWFNPFIYLYARSVEENHEFEVDRAMARGTDKHNYANLLLHLSVAGQGMLYHNFSKVPLKKRITMLFNQPSANMKKIIYVLILPVVLISCLAFARLKSNNAKNDIYSRSTLTKTNGEIYDKVLVTLGNHASASANISHTAKVGFIYANKLYNEDEFKSLPKKELEKIAAQPQIGSTEKQFFSVLRKMGYKVNMADYDMIFTFGTLEQTHEKAIADAIKASMADSKATSAERLKNSISTSAAGPQISYSRTEIKKAFGKSYDKVKIERFSGGWAETTIAHNAKVGFFIDHDFYTEEAFLKILPQLNIGLALKGSFGVTDSVAFTDLPKRGFKADLTGYAAVFEFDYKLDLVTNEFKQEIDTIKHNKTLGAKNVNWKQIVANYRKSDDFKRILSEVDLISATGTKEILVKRKLNAAEGDSRNAGFLVTYKGIDYDLVTDEDTEFKILDNLLKPGEKLQLKVLGTTRGMNHKRVGFEPYLVMKNNKIIFQYSRTDLYPQEPFKDISNGIKFAVGNISDIKKYPNGKWKSATFTTLEEYRIIINFKPDVPDIKFDELNDMMYLRFVNEVKTGLKSYSVSNWISISTDSKDYGIKNPELFNKYYQEAKVSVNQMPQKGSPLRVFSADSLYLDKIYHTNYLYGNVRLKHNETEINADYIKYDTVNDQLFASGRLSSKIKNNTGKVTFKAKDGNVLTADSLKIDLKTDKMIAWGGAVKF